MAKKFSELRDKMSPNAQAKASAMTTSMLADVPLAELRKARSLTQASMAGIMEVKQPEISKIEGRTDMYISTLRSYINAMGGDLDIVARFPDGDIRINQFNEIGDNENNQEAAIGH